jgi:hypothetical protein
MILYFIISVVTGAALFLCTYAGFKQGLRLGMNTAQGKVPEPIRSPVQTVISMKNDIDLSKETQKEAAEIAAMFAYNGDKPKEE